MRKITTIILAILVGIIIPALYYVSWRVERWINWKFGYSQMVKPCNCPLNHTEAAR